MSMPMSLSLSCCFRVALLSSLSRSLALPLLPSTASALLSPCEAHPITPMSTRLQNSSPTVCIPTPSHARRSVPS
ncbi:hypothetical protein BC567DRAFT_223672 [Phyllosticta citribraziliensis]